MSQRSKHDPGLKKVSWFNLSNNILVMLDQVGHSYFKRGMMMPFVSFCLYNLEIQVDHSFLLRLFLLEEIFYHPDLGTVILPSLKLT